MASKTPRLMTGGVSARVFGLERHVARTILSAGCSIPGSADTAFGVRKAFLLHKRREEASKEAKREIETEKCIPGLKRSFDYEVLPEIG
jgi:hypothetical protein